MPLGNYLTMPATSYPQKGKDALIAPRSGGQLVLAEVSLENNTGGAADVGFGWKLPNALWSAGQWVNASTTFTDDTTDAQDADAGDFAVTTTTNNDGFIIQADRPFNLIGITVSQAQAGSPVYEYNYWNGSAYTALTTKEVPGSYTVADQFIVFQAPHDWAVGGSGTNVSQTKYTIRMRATTAPSTAVLATILWVGQLFRVKESLANATKFTFDLEATQIVVPAGAGLLPYFGGTANANNQVEALYKTIGQLY